MTRQEILGEIQDLLKKAKSELPEDDYRELLVDLEEEVVFAQVFPTEAELFGRTP